MSGTLTENDLTQSLVATMINFSLGSSNKIFFKRDSFNLIGLFFLILREVEGVKLLHPPILKPASAVLEFCDLAQKWNSIFSLEIYACYTAQKMEFCVKDFFIKYEQIRR